ncbi:MAG: dephospho-CoA kinase [Nanoarchaeota archaeon]
MFNNKILLGITGEKYSGKSYASKILVNIATNKYKLQALHISYDELGSQILSSNKEYLHIREELVDLFRSNLLLADSSINTTKLQKLIFNDEYKSTLYNKFMEKNCKNIIQHNVNQIQNGLILLEAALLAENNLYQITQNNVLLMSVSKEVQYQRARQEQTSKHEFKQKSSFQLTFKEKKEKIQYAQNTTKQGILFNFDTSNNPSPYQYSMLLENIIRQYF